MVLLQDQPGKHNKILVVNTSRTDLGTVILGWGKSYDLSFINGGKYVGMSIKL